MKLQHGRIGIIGLFIIILALLCYFPFCDFILPVNPPKGNIILQLGNTNCSIRIYQSKYAIATLIALHGNENTCIAASLALPHPALFTLYDLLENGNRLIKYSYSNKNYYFDPNRIFSKEGIMKTLKKYNKSYPENLIAKVKKFSEAILKIAAIKSSSK